MTATKVLVIDDEESNLIYLSTLLEDYGFAPLTASEAKAGAELARTEHPDLICLDIMMPKQSGISFYRDLKRDTELRSIPVIFVSAFTLVRDLRDPVAFRRMIPDESIPLPESCFEKPIDTSRFIDTVAELTKRVPQT